MTEYSLLTMYGTSGRGPGDAGLGREVRHLVGMLQLLPLSTHYPDIVDLVSWIRSDGGSAAARGSSDGSVWHVPKRDLIVGLQVAFQKRWLEVARGCAEAAAFREELLGMRMRVSATGDERYGGRGHDDLVLAAALAWWRIRRCMAGVEPQGRLV